MRCRRITLSKPTSMPTSRRPACLGNPFSLPLEHHFALELREAGKDGENELARRALGVDRLTAKVEHAKASPAILDRLKPLHDVPKANC